MTTQRWLITGASGQLGSHVVHHLTQLPDPAAICAWGRRPGIAVAGLEIQGVDLANAAAIRAATEAFRPTHVLHLGALTAVGACHADPAAAEQINVVATQTLAQAAPAARFIFASTDMVFDGQSAPYRESDPPCPLSHYGRSKLAAEQALHEFEHVLIVRLPLMYGFPCAPRDTTFVQQMAALRAQQPLRLFTDEYRTPVWLADAARALIGLAQSDLTGLIHVAGPERLSRYDLVARCAQVLGMSEDTLIGISRNDIAAAEPRPEDLSLDRSQLAQHYPELVPGPLRAEALQNPLT